MSRLQFGGVEEEKIKQAVGTFCSNQPFALEIIKTKQKKDSRFTSFIQVPRLRFTPLQSTFFPFFFLGGGEKWSEKDTKTDGAKWPWAPFKGNYTFLESKPVAAFCLCLQHCSHPEREKEEEGKKELLPGDHLTYFIRSPFRKRRATDCVADCSSKILFPSRCCGSPNTPCCSRTSQSTQVPNRMPGHVGVGVWGGGGGSNLFRFFYIAHRYKSRLKAARLNLAIDGTHRWMWTDVGIWRQVPNVPDIPNKAFYNSCPPVKHSHICTYI